MRLSFRKFKNIFMLSLLALASLVALIPLFSIFIYVLQKGMPALNTSFFTNLPAPVGETGGGMANAIVGTLVLIACGCLFGIPWGIATGVYLSEYKRYKKTNAFLRLGVDLLAAVPSIIVGLFAYALIVIPMKGFSTLAGSFALMVILIPIVARSTETLLQMVPPHIREAGLGLGISRWKVTLFIVLRGSLPSIMTGIILAIARISGETAPLLFTSFNNQGWSNSLLMPIASLPVQIYTYAISPFEEWQTQAWAGSFVLVMLVLVINLWVRIRFSTKVRAFK